MEWFAAPPGQLESQSRTDPRVPPRFTRGDIRRPRPGPKTIESGYYFPAFAFAYSSLTFFQFTTLHHAST